MNNSFSQKRKTCNVLALEGGGDKGAYQGGVIKGLIDNLPSNKTRYDVVTGISVGSINAAAFSVFKKGDEKAAADFILETWRSIKSSKTVYVNYWLGPLYALFYKSGLYDTTPLMNFLIKAIKGKKIQKKIVIGSTDIKNGTYMTWDEIDFGGDDMRLIESILASAAFPVIFPMRKVDQNTYVDGGVKNSVDISSGINKCQDMGYEQKDIVVDTILCSGSPSLNDDVDPQTLHPTGILLRLEEIFGYDNTMRDVENVPTNFPDVKMRYVVSPTKKLPFSILPLVFSPKDMETMIEIGVQDGIAAIKSHGEEGNAKKITSEYRQMKIKENRERGRRNKNKSHSTTEEEKLRLLK